ncbi:MAG: DUF4139 domain-containing protein [Chromatiales bacterium]|nr:DUF4139 domain-containing protein [Gammaproteobacteria bacterium]MCP5352106.1 DUF4139 domain-containing protein [Chromatiales bacterium]
MNTVIKLFIAALGVVACAAANAAATSPRLSIYQHDLAFVQERRAIQPDGEGWVDIRGVSELADIDSLHLAPTVGSVIQQAFRNDPPSLVALLERHLGERITVIHTNPGNGEELQLTPRLVAIEGNRVLIADNDRVESVPMDDPAWRFRFASLPSGMDAKPMLRAQLGVVDPQEAELSYLTGGVGWRAHYRLVVDAARGNAQTGDIEGRVAVHNDTAIDWRAATVELVAGSLNRVARAPLPAPRPEMLMRAAAVADFAGAPPEPAREAFGDYHLYTLPMPVTLPARERRDLLLLARERVPVRRDYRFDFGHNNGLYQAISPQDPLPAAIRLRISNDDADPLPAGTWRVYGHDDKGVLRLLGEDNADNVPVGRELRLDIGRAFDVTARRTQTQFRRLNNRETVSDWEVEIANAGASEIDVLVVERFGMNWEISDENERHEQPDAESASWRLKVPAGGSRVLSYQVTTRQR